MGPRCTRACANRLGKVMELLHTFAQGTRSFHRIAVGSTPVATSILHSSSTARGASRTAHPATEQVLEVKDAYQGPLIIEWSDLPGQSAEWDYCGGFIRASGIS